MSKQGREKSEEKYGTVYKSLAVNPDEGLNPLSQVSTNLVASSRNQSELIKLQLHSNQVQ